MADSDIYDRLGKLEVDYATMTAKHEEMGNDLAEIKARVTNHLPHQIAEVKDMVAVVSRRQADMDAVARFISVCTKAVVIIVGLMWTGLQLFGKMWGNR